MYTVTFYSFKGGVGRTMAMVNVAFDLAKKGRTVLMVDFDLEAPGLDAFLEPFGARPSKGVVDFVTDYRASGEPPNVDDYVYEIGTGSDPRVLYMPAGRRGEGYGSRLYSIDWRELYENEDGYLLFEDLKAQWDELYQPDYVFLDSRTGHTDVGGICTRQLPDAVTLLFRLDEQNLEGLTRVVREIQAERTSGRKKDIQLHYVPSNVPRIDDEHEVLKEQVRKFQNRLKYESSNVRIQHYEDLEMLKHSVYSLRRQNTRIAKEYAALSREIARHNVEDIEGARDFLRRTYESPRYQGGERLENRISQIAARHRLDHEILELLANIRQKQGKLTEAIAYLSEAIDTAAPSAEYLIRRAELNVRTDRPDEARADLSEALKIPVDSFFELVRWISLARQVDRSTLQALPSSKAVQSLDIDDKRFIAWELLERDEDTDVADEILQSILDTPDLPDDERRKTYSSLALPLIRDGKFDQVIEYISEPEDIRDTFNLAMAHWGRDGKPQKDLLSRVVELHENSTAPSTDSANYDFCIAIALSAVGRTDDAIQVLNRARQEARDEVGQIFSPWCYRNVSTVDFLEDLEAADEAMRAGAMVPEFVTAAGDQSGGENA